ncbi:uncharacterized protein EV420DRAFT_254732 [Desarmillaria tabescens]|uniref:Uncharacterized protein n=1 Tax=Armillaria tabescens TaxID=1929756 RepID=A0AA39KHX6_ARMTA|nr:uncharacterized protein EV420DRAFT_254732 [Desarmillaria tabescens]KAK0460179.1 hypothetical protein EV420DRAFT_254732 [Desarmillaria tabescens]
MAVILWKKKKRMKLDGNNNNLSSIFPLSLFFRSLTFSVYVLLSIGITSASMFPSSGKSPLWNLALTTPPLGMALSFGSQKDIIAFYRHRKSEEARVT